MDISRKEIIKILQKTLEKKPEVYALWLEGADAHGRVDEFSDIDVWIDVKDGFENETMLLVREALESIAPIDFFNNQEHPHPKIQQNVFHLAGTPETLLLDVCVQSHSREFWFVEEHVDEKAKVLFDRNNVVRYKHHDSRIFHKELRERAEVLKDIFELGCAKVRKCMKRNQFLSSFYDYEKHVLRPLVELLRIYHEPTKREFYLKHIEIDLPEQLVSGLSRLYQVASIQDISIHLEEITPLIEEIYADIEKKYT